MKASMHTVNLLGAKNINQARSDLKWSIAELSDKSGCGIGTIWKFCNGKHVKRTSYRNKMKTEIALQKILIALEKGREETKQWVK